MLTSTTGTEPDTARGEANWNSSTAYAVAGSADASGVNGRSRSERGVCVTALLNSPYTSTTWSLSPAGSIATAMLGAAYVSALVLGWTLGPVLRRPGTWFSVAIGATATVASTWAIIARSFAITTGVQFTPRLSGTLSLPNAMAITALAGSIAGVVLTANRSARLRAVGGAVTIVADNTVSGHVNGITFARQAVVDGKLQATGETATFAADTVLKAIGQKLGNPVLAEAGLTLSGGKIATDDAGATNLKGVWAGGDCRAGGLDLTVEAVEHGKLSANAIHTAIQTAVSA